MQNPEFKQIIEDLKKLLNTNSEQRLKELLPTATIIVNEIGLFLHFNHTNNYHIAIRNIHEALVLSKNAQVYEDLATEIISFSKNISAKDQERYESFSTAYTIELRRFFGDIVATL